MSVLEVAPELDYSSKSIAGGPVYKMMKVYSEEAAAGSLTGAAAGLTKASFILPNSCFNLSKSVLSFIWKQPEVDTKYMYLHSGNIPHIENIKLKSVTGSILAEIPSVGNYSRIVMPYTTSLKRFLNKESNISRATAALCIGPGSGGDMFHRSDTLKSTAVAANTVTARNLDYAGAIQDGQISYTGPCELLDTVVGNGAAAGDAFVQVRLPLGEFVHTLFAINKDFVWNQQLIIEIDFQAANRVGFSATGQFDASTPVAPVSAPVISSLVLYLATQQNDAVTATLRARAQEGFSMPIPYVYMKKTQTGTGSTVVTYRLNRTHGQKLRRVYSALFHSSETSGSTSYCRGNEAAAVCTSVRTFLMNVARQDYSLGVANGECYMHLRELIEDSVIQNLAMYNHCFAWIDDFTGLKTADEGKEHYDSGLDLQLDTDYTIELAINGTAKQLYQYAICQKTLSMKDGMVIVL